jgi:hypothetical protein
VAIFTSGRAAAQDWRVTLFKILIAAHIVTGSIGLIAFWVPVLSRKGSANHKLWGRVFNRTMLATATFALGMSLCTLYDPIGTHPHITPDIGDRDMIVAIFGWMMFGLALLTINLVWYGWQCISNRTEHERNLEWRNVTLQWLLVIASLNCAWQAYALGQPLILGMTAIGLATAGTNLWFLYKPQRGPMDWLLEHIKALVGAGISVYTAFFAFGAVRTFPELALHPGLWAIPLSVGLALIIYHQRDVVRRSNGARGGSELTS